LVSLRIWRLLGLSLRTKLPFKIPGSTWFDDRQRVHAKLSVMDWKLTETTPLYLEMMEARKAENIAI
jgi:hypothetical protein